MSDFFRKLNKPASASLVAFILLASAVTAGSLTPPGAPSSTMNTLAELYDSIVGGFDSTGVVADQNGSLIEHLKYIEANMGDLGVGSDSLDFDEFVDAMTLDANTSVDMNGSTLVFNGVASLSTSTIHIQPTTGSGFVFVGGGDDTVGGGVGGNLSMRAGYSVGGGFGGSAILTGGTADGVGGAAGDLFLDAGFGSGGATHGTLYINNNATGSTLVVNGVGVQINPDTIFGANVSIGGNASVSGNFEVEGKAAFGSLAETNDVFGLTGQTAVSIHEEFTDLSTAFFTAGTGHNYELNPGATATDFIVGEDVFLQIPSANTEDFTGGIVAGRYYPIHLGSGTVSQMDGLQVQPQTDNGTVTQMRGILVSNNTTGTGDIGDAYAIYVDGPLGVGGITNNYGLFVEDQSGSTGDSFNIYSAGAGSLNVFEGNVGIATDSPQETLSVEGDTRLSGHAAIGNVGSVDESVLISPSGFTNSSVLALNEIVTSPATDYIHGISNDLHADLSAPTTAWFIGQGNYVDTVAGSTGDVALMAGTYNAVANYGDGNATEFYGGLNAAANWGAGDITNGYGLYSSYCNCVGTGNTANGFGVYGAAHNSGSGTITNAYDFFAEAQLGSGTITNNYGLYVAAQNGLGVVNGYNIYSAGAGTRNIFEGSASISQNFELSGTVSSNLTPTTTDTFDLGTATLRWRDLYLASGSLHIGVSGDEAVIDYNVNDDYLAFKPDGSTTKMILTDAGRASIGGTPVNPLFATLHVVGNESATLFATNPGILAVTNQNTSSVSLNSLTFNNANDFGGAQIAYIPTGGATSNVGGILLLSTKSTTGFSWSPSMRLENGNVGIGTNFLGDHPDQRLDVTGNIAASTSGNVDLILRSSSAGGDDGKFTIRSNGASDRLLVMNGAGSTIFALSSVAYSGVVGTSAAINTTNTAAALNVTALAATTAGSDILRMNVSGVGGVLDIYRSPSTGLYNLWATGGGTNGIMLHGGNVGIGINETVTTEAVLDVKASQGFDAFNINASASNTSYFRVTGTGRVGIGTATPNDKLDVTGAIEFNIASSSGALDSFALCHNVNGNSSDQELLDCGNAPIADYMEMYPMARSVQEGDIVMISDRQIQTTNGQGTVPELVKADDRNLAIGIVSVAAHAGDFNSIGYNIPQSARPMPLALVGRVNVRISMENGPISAGDPVALSGTPGIGAKAETSGFIIGRALEPASSAGTVLVFVNPTYWAASAAELTDGAPPVGAGPSWLSGTFSDLFAAVVNSFRDVLGVVFERGGRIRATELCLDDVCVTKEQLREMLNNQGVATPEPSDDPTPTPTAEPEETPMETPDAEPTLTPEPKETPPSDGESEPDSTPEPPSEPSPIDSGV